VFDARDLVATSNIPEDRIRAFALVEIDGDGYLSRIVEKPGVSSSVPPDGGSCADADVPPAGSYARAGVSMNLWRFDTRVFDACRDVPRSARGEYELPEAVALAIGRGVRFRALRARGPVLDLSRRADAADVERRLAGVVPRP
jgi:glucose-1-phosphate thymidylyltransferase